LEDIQLNLNIQPVKPEALNHIVASAGRISSTQMQDSTFRKSAASDT